MPRKRTVVIPEGLRCPECSSVDLRGAGKDWKGNKHGDNPPRVKVQRYLCKACGFLFRENGN